MERNVTFYDNFHAKSKTASNIIGRNNFTYRYALSVIESTLKLLKKDNIKLLDYGCGDGTVDFYVAKSGINTTGLDLSEKAIKTAKRSSINIGLNDNTQFYNLLKGIKKIRKEKYNIIICLEVIEHVRHDSQLIKYLVNHLNQDGILIVSTPSINAPLFKIGLAKKFDEKVGHLRRYSGKKLINLMTENKLKILSVYKTEGILRNSLFLFNMSLVIRIANRFSFISDILTFIDNLTIPIIGESNIFIVAKKI